MIGKRGKGDTMARLLVSFCIAATILCTALCTPLVARAQGRAGGVTEEEETFQAAEAAFKDNRDDDALHLYEKVTTLSPTRSDAWVRQGVILYKQKKYKEGVDVLVRARKLLPDDPALTGQLGLTLYKLNKTDAAVSLLEEAVAKLPDAYQFQLQLGQHFVKIGDGKRGVAAFESYFRTRPESAAGSDPPIRAFSGTAYLLNHQYEQAESDLNVALKTNPRDIAAQIGLGAVYTARGEWSKGIAMYERVSREAPRQPSIWLNLGTCLFHMNQRAEAEKNALAYTGVRPGEARGFLLLGDVRTEKRDYPKALEAYEAARKAEPGSPQVVAQVAAREGRVELAQKQYPKAKESLEEALKAQPEDVESLAGLAEAYIATQEPRDKLIDLGERLSKLPAQPSSQSAQPALHAGLCFYAAGDDARALKAFEAAAADPQSFRARNGQAKALNRLAAASVEKSDLAGAETQLRRAQQLFPDSVVTLRNLGLVYVLQGKFADAEAVLRLAFKDPHDPQHDDRMTHDLVINRLIGRALVGQKKHAEAIPFYEAAVQAGQKTRGPQLAEVLTDVGPLYLENERYDLAVLALETAVKEAGSAQVATAASRNLAIAYLRRGIDRLDEAPQAQASLDDIARAASVRAVLTPKESAAVGCALALATLKVGRPQPAMDALARAQKEGGCTFKAPFDKLGLEFFSAYAAYREAGNPARREQAARSFQKLIPKVSGALAEQLKDLTRSSYEYEGVDFYTRGDRKKAGLALKNAQHVPSRGEHRELDHNLAVIDMEEGHGGAAEKVFETLGSKPPEALVNLGILRDRDGDSRKALDLYKRALERGARAPHLREWVDVKERVFARAAASSSAPGSPASPSPGAPSPGNPGGAR